MRDRTKRLIALILGATLVFGTSAFALAGTEFQSNGRFEYKSDQNATEPDVILDSADLNTIYEEVSVGRGSIATALNNIGYGKLSGSSYTANDSFTSLKEAVENQFTIPANGGSSEVYYKTSEGELTTDKTLAADYDSGTDTATELTLANATANNLSAGTMAWDNEGNLIIGTGADNKSYYELGFSEGYESGFNEGVTQTTMLLKDLTFTIAIPVRDTYRNKGVGTMVVTYANGGTSWTPASSSRAVKCGGWAEGAPYVCCWISSALVNINGVNDYTVTIYVGTETGKIYGSADSRGAQTIITRFKDGEVTNSGGASYDWSSQDEGYSCGSPTWSNVNTYNP